MKKLIMFLSFIIIPFEVKADAITPKPTQIKSYTVEVTNGNGVVCYDYGSDYTTLVSKFMIPAKEQLEVIEEYTFNDIIYGYVNYNDNECYIKLSDVVNISKEVTIDDENVNSLSEAKTAYVLKDNLEVHSGPAEGYDIVTTLDKGTSIKITHYYGSYSAWYYIDNIGWINRLDGSIGFKQNETIMILKDLLVYDLVPDLDNAKEIYTIKEGTEFDEYYSLDSWSDAYYIKTDDFEGYIDYGHVAFKENYQVHLFSKYSAYEDFETAYDYNKSDSYSLIIPEGSELQVNYYYRNPYTATTADPNYYQVTYNGKTYWIIDEISSNLAIVYKTTAVVKEKVKVTKEYNSDDSIGTLKQGETVDVLYELYNYYYIKTDTLEGWVDGDYLDVEELDIDEINQEEVNNNEEVIEIKSKSLSKNEIIYLSVGLALSIGLMAGVIIIIINKKKKLGDGNK